MFTYKLIEFNNNKRLVRCIDQLMIETLCDITEILKDKIEYLHFALNVCMIVIQ